MKRSLSVLALVFAFVSPAFADTLLAQLQAIPGMTATESTSAGDRLRGLRRFALQLEQPVDHFVAESGTFKQKLVLFHRDAAAPMVLQTSGYAIFGEALTELAQLFDTNQVQVEHRYFLDSTPNPRDWTKLTVRQSAADFHRVVEALKPLYRGRWINTGASKGGMTSIYHRRFYPNDLDGTVADVAPLSFTTEDPRYIGFVETVGGDRYADCRAKLENVQRLLLENRDAIVAGMEGTHTALGGKDGSLEHAVIELPFAFWQYGNPEDPVQGCSAIPTDGKDVARLANFAKMIANPSEYGDDTINFFQAYYYQAAAELGGPGAKLSHLTSLLRHPYQIAQYLPGGLAIPYTDTTMQDVKNWVATEATGLMFVYGEFDPWTAGAFRDLNPATGADNHWYLAPQANHGANVTGLAQGDSAKALETLSQWMGRAPVTVGTRPFSTRASLDDIEFAVRRGRQLRR